MAYYNVQVDVYSIDLEVEADSQDDAANKAVARFYELGITDLEVEVFEMDVIAPGGTE